MYKIRANHLKNRLYVSVEGLISNEEAEVILQEIISEIDLLKTGFDVISDISKIRPASKRAVEKLLAIQMELRMRNVGKVVRIVGREVAQVVGKIQFERSARKAGLDAETAESFEEAENLLDG